MASTYIKRNTIIDNTVNNDTFSPKFKRTMVQVSKLNFEGYCTLYTPVEEQITQILTIRSERPVSSDSILRVYDRDSLNSAISMSVE